MIHPSKIGEVEQLLYYLQNRKENVITNSDYDGKKKPLSDKLEDPNIDDINETANINDLDDYAEMLYEDDLKAKIRGSALILQLARNPDNLEELFQNESVLNPLIAHYKIGNLTVQIIEFELRRCETWQTELDKRRKGQESNNKSRPKSGKNKEQQPVLSPQDEKIIKELQRLIAKQEQLLRGSI